MRALNNNEEKHNENAIDANSGDAFNSLTDEESDDFYQNDLLD